MMIKLILKKTFHAYTNEALQSFISVPKEDYSEKKRMLLKHINNILSPSQTPSLNYNFTLYY